MPSRKKAQGQARKAKRAAGRAQSNPTGAAAACNHFGQPITNWSRDDWDVVLNLVGEYEAKLENAFDERNNVHDVVNLTYDKYHKFNDARKELFRRTLLVRGTKSFLIDTNETDLTKESTGYISYILMYQTIEVRDKHNGAWDRDIDAKIQDALIDIVACPRQIIRFFHKRNYCDCLQNIYYNLKEATERIAVCSQCTKLVNIKQLSQCAHCESALYCSYECAVANWSEHKEQCKKIRDCRKCKENPKETVSESFDDIEQVD